MKKENKAPTSYGFLLLGNYSMIAVSSAIEVLRMANQLGREEFYKWGTYTLDGEPIHASNGLIIQPGGSIEDSFNCDVLFVCGGVRIHAEWQDSLKRHLHKLDSRGVIIGGLCTGTYILARAGLMDGYRCTVHWENIASLREIAPEVIVTEELFELDKDRYTAAGGSAPLDMMLHIVKRDHGNKLAVAISEQFMCDRMRGPYDKQRIPLKLLVGTNQPKLTEEVALMEANLEELLPLDDLAGLVGEAGPVMVPSPGAWHSRNSHEDFGGVEPVTPPGIQRDTWRGAGLAWHRMQDQMCPPPILVGQVLGP